MQISYHYWPCYPSIVNLRECHLQTLIIIKNHSNEAFGSSYNHSIRVVYKSRLSLKYSGKHKIMPRQKSDPENFTPLSVSDYKN